MSSGRPAPAGPSPRAVVAEQIAVAASSLARIAGANGMARLSDLLDQAILEAWREASEADDLPAAAPAE